MRVLLLGATGTAGRAAARAVSDAGHDLVCAVRPGSEAPAGASMAAELRELPDAVRAAAPDALMSCLASRTGAPEEARAVDRDAHLAVFAAARETGVGHVVLLSAICVQRPMLVFQHAKLEAEAALRESGMDWSIVRPTAFFKSLSGQVARVAAGKPYLMFGDGTMTACKPISDRDLGAYLAGCLSDPMRRNRVLPVGGPGPAVTPKDMARMLFDLTGRPERYRRVPVGMFTGAAAVLGAAARLRPSWERHAEMARIARYYATESMLVWKDGRYDAEATPEFGRDALRDHYAALLRGDVADDRGAHALI